MEELSRSLIGEFIDAVVQEPDRAAALLAEHPGLLNARWIHGETVLHFLAVEGFAQGVTFLAARGADVNAANKFGDSPLIDVATLGRDHIADTLLRHGADPNALSLTRDNALDAAVRRGYVRLVDLLLTAGADPRYRTHFDESIFDAVECAPDQREALLATLHRHGILPQESDGP